MYNESKKSKSIYNEATIVKTEVEDEVENEMQGNNTYYFN